MHVHSPTDSVVVDCDRCLVRSPAACGDCIVTVLLGAPPAGIEIDAQEMAALEVLADAGCVPPLRLVTPGPASSVTPGSAASVTPGSAISVTPVTGPQIEAV